MLLSLAVPSTAAPDRTITLSPTARGASWNSPTNIGTYIYGSLDTDPQTRSLQGCDETLVQLIKPGTLRLDITARGPVTASDVTYLTLRVHRSDASGNKGQQLGVAFTQPSASVTVKKAVPGYYLAEVAWREGVASVDGKATFTPGKPR